MSRHRRHCTLISSLLLIGTATGISTTVTCVAASGADSVQDAGFSEVTVPLPTFPYEDYCLKPHKSPADDQEFPSSNRVPRTLQILRARNLLAAGHYDEAIADYREGLPQWKVPYRFRQTAEHEFELACEKIGKIDDAIKHAKLAGSDELIARLYLKERRFAEAKAIADNNVLDNKIFDFDNHYAEELGPWLQFRAAVKCHLGQYESAVGDLKEAAQKYYEGDTEAANTCVQAANVLIERFKMGPPFRLEAAQLPAKGKDKVIELVRFLSTSPKPLSISELNRITGARIKLPSTTWRNIHQEEKEIRPFDHLEYRSEDDNLEVPELLMVHIATDQCCVPKAEIDLLLPTNGSKIPPISTWSESDESPYAEAWKLPTGRLFLRFGKGGARVLNYLEFNALKPEEKVTAEQLKRRAQYYWDEKEKKVSTLTDAIKLDDQMIELYVDRAIAYCDLGRFNEALIDAKRAVTLGGRFYLDEQSMVEEKMGDLSDAIEHYKAFIGERTPGPETASRYARLAELYVKTKQYRDALEASEKALIDSKEKSAALFVKAQAEAGIGNLESARADAKSAADDYFSKAQIVLRDRVLEWLKTLPLSQSQ